MSKTWIKLYTEALHDRKMWKLKPIEQLAFWYLCILAGTEDNGGALPSVDDIELELQMPLKLKRAELDSIISRLISLGLLDKSSDNVLTVTNFEKRQMSAMTEAEKKQAYRDRKRTEEGQVSDQCPDTVRTDVREMSTLETELRIKKKEEEKELNTLTADAVEVLPPAKAIDWKRAFGPEAGRAMAFSEVTGIIPIKSEFGRWQKDLKAFTEAGISIDQMKAACVYMKREKLTIGAPGSLFKIARSMKNAAPTDPQSVSDFPDFYSAIQALTDHPEIIDL